MGQNLLFYIKNNKRTNKKKNTDIIKKRVWANNRKLISHKQII